MDQTQKSKSRNKDNQTKLILGVSLIILVVSLLTFAISFSNLPVYTQEIQVVFEIGNKTGVNLDRTDILDFGRISLNSVAMGRMVQLTNNKDFPVLTQVVFSKEIKDFLSASQKELILPGESKNITLWLKVPLNLEEGVYSGTVKFELKRVKG